MYTAEWELYRGSRIGNVSGSSTGIPESIASNGNASFQNGPYLNFANINVCIGSHISTLILIAVSTRAESEQRIPASFNALYEDTPLRAELLDYCRSNARSAVGNARSAVANALQGECLSLRIPHPLISQHNLQQTPSNMQIFHRDGALATPSTHLDQDA
ncbi:hypothetical protein CVT25_006287 [Psilocybe cyanescens]|uniref:Uncharacterized protein n=1 Tax=Psilocybe cyanescens TaxID=93625 RepID=A0A409X3Z2_PSICY|nr:hypothetical protein CVT25_006287 [Psilocybe cyanescens]